MEYRASRRWGVELSATRAEVVSEVEFEIGVPELLVVESRIDTTPILARVNWHLTPESKADVYVGPVAGWVRYSDVDVTFKGPIEVINVLVDPDIATKDGFAWGAHLGLDVPFGSGGWFFNGGLTFLKAEVESRDFESNSFDLDPLTAHVGVGYRF